MKDKTKQKQEVVIVPKKALLAILPALPIIGVLLSKREAGSLILFILGIILGAIIAKGFFEKRN